ncbi:MAG: hypothetical protein IJZ30_04710 [Alphaproteobacteria bacterium]|nr:hypothetical protein [Alphaproteobacteria bacterium]
MLSILLPAIALFKEFNATSRLAFWEDERVFAYAISAISTSAIKLSADIFKFIKSKVLSSGFSFCCSSFSDVEELSPSVSSSSVFSSSVSSSVSSSPPPVSPVAPPVPPVPPPEPEFRVVLKKT